MHFSFFCHFEFFERRGVYCTKEKKKLAWKFVVFIQLGTFWALLWHVLTYHTSVLVLRNFEKFQHSTSSTRSMSIQSFLPTAPPKVQGALIFQGLLLRDSILSYFRIWDWTQACFGSMCNMSFLICEENYPSIGFYWIHNKDVFVFYCLLKDLWILLL